MLRPLALVLPAVAGGGSADATEPIPVLVVSGVNNHDCEWTAPELESLLSSTGRFTVDVTTEPARTLADAASLARYRALVLDYNGPRWGEPAESTFLAAVSGGTGVAVVHAANNAFPGWEEYERLVGDLWREGTGHGKFHAFDVRILDATHPVTRGMTPLRAHPDELYHGLVRTPGADHVVLAVAHSSEESGGSGKDEPMILAGSYGAGRVFHTPLGHVWRGSEESRQSYRDPAFRELVARGVEWAATGAVAPETPWIPLFDGTSRAAWRGYGKEGFPERGWRVEGDALVCEGGGGDLVTRQEWDDFVLEFEWRVSPRASGGVLVRVVEGSSPSWHTGPEYPVIDPASFEDGVDPLQAAGALYGIAPAREAPVGEWNRGRIVVRATRITHFLNDVLVAECDLAAEDGRARVAASKFADLPFFRSPRGRIALRDHGDEVAYRNVRVRPLP